MTQTAVSATQRWKVIAAGYVGNLAEWYDFAVFGFFVTIIGPQFFPADDPFLSLMAAFGAFAAGFLARPLGGALFGYIGDKWGRARALNISIWAMAIPTFMLGLLPNYETVGLLAPLLLLALRIVQGLSVGGEFTSSIVFLVESAPDNQRAFVGSWAKVGASSGVLLGSVVGITVTTLLSEQQVAEWGWRIPFLFGGLAGLVGALIRRSLKIDEPEPPKENPIGELIKRHWPVLLRNTLVKITYAVGYYTTFIYAVTYIREIDGLESTTVFELNILTMVFLLVLTPLAAMLSDRIGRKPLLLFGAGMLAFGGVPMFWLIHHLDPMIILIGELGLALGVASFSAGITAASAESFPPEVRCSGMALGHNTAMALFGGTTPLIATWLIASSGDPLAPGYWVAATSMISLIVVVFFYQETKGVPLRPAKAIST